MSRTVDLMNKTMSSLGIFGQLRFGVGMWIVIFATVIGGDPLRTFLVESVLEELKESEDLSVSES